MNKEEAQTQYNKILELEKNNSIESKSFVLLSHKKKQLEKDFPELKEIK